MKRKRLGSDDIEFIKKSELSSMMVASIVGCSVSTVDYHRNRGIWSKNKVKR